MTSGETPLQDRARPWQEPPPVEAQLEVPLGAPSLSPKELEARRWAVRCGIAAVVFVFLYSVSYHTEQAPTYALVARDPLAKVYLSPSCAFGRGNLPTSTIGAARQDGYRPDPACEKSGSFLGAGQTVMQELLSTMHLYPKRGTRWRPDGSWKW